MTPPEEFESAYRALGFSAEAARSYAAMTRISVDRAFAMPDDPVRGPTTLAAYLADHIDGRG